MHYILIHGLWVVQDHVTNSEINLKIHWCKKKQNKNTHTHTNNNNKKKIKQKQQKTFLWSQKKCASAGNRTRVNCLEGSYAHHYATDAG